MSTPAAPRRYLPEVREEAIASEWQRVTAWRLKQLLRCGYDKTTAVWMSDRHDIDLHLAERLARDAGQQLAFKILY